MISIVHCNGLNSFTLYFFPRIFFPFYIILLRKFLSLFFFFDQKNIPIHSYLKNKAYFYILVMDLKDSCDDAEVKAEVIINLFS